MGNQSRLNSRELCGSEQARLKAVGKDSVAVKANWLLGAKMRDCFQSLSNLSATGT
jgi:hypothetical protein